MTSTCVNCGRKIEHVSGNVWEHVADKQLTCSMRTTATPNNEPLPKSAFDSVIEEIVALHYKKQSDYGRMDIGDPFANVRASEDFGIPGYLGAIIRANDKVRRLQKFARGGTMVNESAEDSMLDAAVYFIIALCLFREENNGTV